MQPLSYQIGAPPHISHPKAAQACTSILSEKYRTTWRLSRSEPMPPGERQKQLFLTLYKQKNEYFPLQSVEIVPQFDTVFLQKYCYCSHYRAVDIGGLPGILLWPRQHCHCALQHGRKLEFHKVLVWNFHMKKNPNILWWTGKLVRILKFRLP